MAKEILIADSDKADQEEFQRIFETTDYHLIFSENGEEALLRIKLFKPDMIIASGTGLQEMGGLELCGFIKGDPEFKHIPFILISSLFDGISEGEQKRVHADGMISKPLNEGEILHLVNRLMEGSTGERGEIPSEEKETLFLDELGEGKEEEEEIIELVDVVEEPESRVSINDLFTVGREESIKEAPSFELWEKRRSEELEMEKELSSPPEREKDFTEEMEVQLEEEHPPLKPIPEEDLLKKIKLEEVLEKVEQLRPSVEKEWPSEKGEEVVEETSLPLEEPPEKYLDLSEFEKALQNEVKPEEEELTLAPPSFKLDEERGQEKVAPLKELIEEEEIKEISEEEIKEISEEEFPDELLEEILEEEEIRVIEEPQEALPPEVSQKEMETIETEMEAPKEAEVFEEMVAPEEGISTSILEEEIKPLVSPIQREMEEVSTLGRVVDKHLEEVIAKGIQEMVGDFITKILPEMTQHIIGLTAERIEKLVREIVPDLAEKAIQEEIQRLQKGDKN